MFDDDFDRVFSWFFPPSPPFFLICSLYLGNIALHKFLFKNSLIHALRLESFTKKVGERALQGGSLALLLKR